MAQKSNYALISALYASTNKGLYSDIYFPIIKYSIAKIFFSKGLENGYCTADAVNQFIKERFGINIPIIVIAKTVAKISVLSGSEDIVVYEKGNSFNIKRTTFIEDTDIDNKEQRFSEKLEEIERLYREFLNEQGCYDDGVTFVQFISDNTDDILGYFEDEDSAKVGEQYATLVFFLQYLHDNDKALYEVANQLFWSSVIAAFLKSERPVVEDAHEGLKSEFFLDTSIVMGMLNLSNPLREIYSKEVCEIIKASSGILRVNPITLEEIKYILSSVEANGANPSTDIASACDRRHLKTNDIAQIRLHLEEIVEKNEISVLPPMSSEEKLSVKSRYKGKKIVRLLGEFRRKVPDPYSDDNFREIHDIYMDDYIKSRRKSKSDVDNIYFLTANIDLISFCKEQHPGSNYMISTGKVILDLWMHNTKPVDISSCVLTETMAHCLDLHSVKVRSKIAEVSKVYNQTKDNFDPLVYKDFISKLYRRAKNVIVTTETDPDNQNKLGVSWSKLIHDAVIADNEHYNKIIATVKQEKKILTEQVLEKDEILQKQQNEIDSIKSLNSEKQNAISSLSKKNDKLESELSVATEEIQNKTKMVLEAAKESKRKERIINLHERKEKISEKISSLQNELIPYENERNRSFRNWTPKMCFAVGVILVFLPVLIYVLDFYEILVLKSYRYWIFGSSVTIAIFFFNRYYALNSNIEKRRKTAYAKWEEKIEHAAYCEKKKQIKQLTTELETINLELDKCKK